MSKYIPMMVKTFMFVKRIKEVFNVKIHGFDSWTDLLDKCMSNNRKEDHFNEFVQETVEKSTQIVKGGRTLFSTILEIMNKIIKKMNNSYTNVKTKKDLANFKYMSIDFERRVEEFVKQVKGSWTDAVFASDFPKTFVDNIGIVQ